MSIFLGYPPQHIVDWIYAHSPNAYWDTIAYNLENLPKATFVTGKTEFDLNELPAPGTSLPIDYIARDGYYDGATFVPTLTTASVMSSIDMIETVQTEWVVLGYNGHVPKYVKYKSKSGNVVYVSSTGDGETRTDIVAGAAIYAKAYDASMLENTWRKLPDVAVTSVGSEAFTYGQTNADWGTTAGSVPYNVPMSIKIDDVDYAFCGYTMTVNSKNVLCTSANGVDGASSFAFSSSNSTDWRTSELRTWLNTQQGANEHMLPKWCKMDTTDWSTVPVCAANGLKLKLAKQSRLDSLGNNNLLMNVIPVVNRVWNNDESKAKDVEDMFFVLSNAEVNCDDGDVEYTVGTFHDNESSLASFDVFKPFTTLYAMNLARIRTTLKLDTDSDYNSFYYWLRSAGMYNTARYAGICSTNDGAVMLNGVTDAAVAGCSPVFVIG